MIIAGTKLGASPQSECWNSGILESWVLVSGSQRLGLGKDNGMVGLEIQNRYY